VAREGLTVADVRITMDDDGFYIVHDDVRPTDDHGRELDLPYDVQLPRCGYSQNQPFCDGTHTAIDFDGTPAN
jgi:CDGSH iron-sulfur domain-containing protein 3